ADHGGIVVDRGGRAGVPTAVLHRLDQTLRLGLDRVDGSQLGALLETQRRPEARQRTGVAAPDLRCPQNREHEVYPRLTLGSLAEHVQAVADLRILDLTQPPVD